MPIMPYEKGTRAFVLAILACGVILTLSSFYVVQGELKIKHRNLLGNKLLVSSIITLLFGGLLILGSILFLSRA